MNSEETTHLSFEPDLSESELGYRLLFQKNILPFLVVDVKTLEIIEVNRAALNKYGYPRQEFIGKNLIDIRPPEEVSHLLEFLEKIKEIDSTDIIKTRHLKKSGEIMDVEVAYHRAIFKRRESFIVFVNDVTERNRQAAELARSQAERIKILDSITDPFILLDKDWKITHINGEAEKTTLLPPGKAVGKTLWEVYPESFDSVFHEEYQKVFDTKKPAFFEGYYPPLRNWFEIRAYPLEDGIGIYFRNVTERKQQEEQIRRQAELLEQSYDAIFIWEFEDGITSWNKNAERLYGFTEQEAIGHTPFELLQTVFPTSVSKFYKELEKHKKWEGEIIHTAKDGREIIVESRFQYFINLEGKAMVMETCHDITARKRTGEELARAAKLSLIGELAASLAHEIKNPLAGIKGAIDVLIKRREEGDMEREVMENITYLIERIDQTVRALLSRSHIRPLQSQNVSLNQTISRALRFAHHHTSVINKGNGKIKFNLSLPENELIVPHDPAQIEDAILNLILNAKEAIGDGKGEITVKLSEAETKNGQEVFIRITDTGRGIAEEQQKNIFTPFYTTSTNGGAGLGLTAVKRISRAHGGNCDISSKVGQGTTFTIHFPVNLDNKSW